MNSGSLTPPLRDLGGSSPRFPSQVEREYDLVCRLDGVEPGEHWLAKRRDNQQQAILRIVPRDTLSSNQSPYWEHRLVLASRMPPHPNVIPVLSTEASGDRVVFATAHVDGEDLSSLIRHSGAMPWEVAAECLRHILTGLSHAHAHGVAHGDLQPCNVVLDWAGVAAVGNWGEAPAPPTCDLQCLVAKDLRGAAEILYWTLTGKEAPSAGNLHVEHHDVNSRVFAEAPAELTIIYQRLATAGSPTGFASAGEAIEALGAVMSASSVDDHAALASAIATEPGASAPSQEQPFVAESANGSLGQPELPAVDPNPIGKVEEVETSNSDKDAPRTAVLTEPVSPVETGAAPVSTVKTCEPTTESNIGVPSALWVYGSIAVGLATTLALLAYWLSR